MHAQAVFALALAGVAIAMPPGPLVPRHGHDASWGWDHKSTTTTTRTVTAYTTYCPEPTTLEFNGKHYTVTEATTLTITDCPCTVVGGHQPTAKPEPDHKHDHHQPGHHEQDYPKPEPPKMSHDIPPPQTAGPVAPAKTPSPPSGDNSPSPNPPVKVSGAESHSAKFGVAVMAGAALAGLLVW